MGMKEGSLKRQAAVTAVSGALVRAMGFGIRLWVSRLLGAEAMGILELASSAHALAVTPGAAGVPGAVSRLAARSGTDGEAAGVMRAGRRIALRVGLAISLVFLLLSPWIAGWLGDARALPALVFYAPCALLIALSSVYDGLFFGRGRALAPNLSELTEQAVRFLAVAALSFLIPRLTPAWRAAAPAFGAMLGEAAGLLIVWSMAARSFPRAAEAPPGTEKRIIRLALPLLATRLSHAGLRSLCAFVIPLRLMAGGLDHREALSRLGMMNGMVLPLVFLPGLLTGALAAVGGPAMARCKSAWAERRLAGRVLLLSLLAGAGCAALLYVFSPFLALSLYRLPELAALIRLSCPLAVFMAVQQAASGLMTGLGLQKKALFASLPGSALTLVLTWLWTPVRGIGGAVLSSLFGHGLTLFWCLIYLFSRLTQKKTPLCTAAQ